MLHSSNEKTNIMLHRFLRNTSDLSSAHSTYAADIFRTHNNLRRSSTQTLHWWDGQLRCLDLNYCEFKAELENTIARF